MPGSRNCTGPPRASATQVPHIAPRARDLSERDIVMAVAATLVMVMAM